MSDMGTPEHSQPPDPHDLVRGWYKEYRTGVYRYLCSLLGNEADADDAFQASFVSLLRQGTALARVRQPKAYVYRTARNCAISLLRKNEQAPVPLDELGHEPAAKADQRTELADLLDWALAKLPSVQREVVTLKVCDQMTFREVAKVTNMLLPTAASHYWRGMRTLRLLLNNHHEH